VILISTNAVGMAPAGLAVAVAAVAIGNFVTTTAAATTVIMSTNQKLLLTATLLAFLGLTVHQFFKANPSQESVAPVALAHGTGGGNQSRSTAGRSRAESFAPTTRRAGKVTPDFVALADALRAALHAAPRSRLGTRSYPPDEVAQAILNYGSYRKEAFSILVEAARSADLETRKRAISAMGFVGMPSTPQRAQQGLIGEPAPDAKAFLWAVVREPNQELAHFALSGLRSIGFDATEIPSLVALMMKGSDDQLRRYLPEVIAETLAADPVSAAPYLAELEELLNHADPRLRFQAACALAKQRAATQPEILPHLTTGLQSREHLEQLMALETLQKIGKDAEPVLPALMTYANTVQDDVLRRVAFTTIGAIKQELRSVLTGVDQALQEQERTAKWQQKFTSGDYSHEDLMAALKEPLFTVRAAQKLAESGVAAKDAVPAMLESLAGKDQASRDQIMEAIGKIDPSVTVSKINSRIVAQAGVYARLKLEEQEPTKERAFMVRLLQKQLMGNSEWVTQEELRLLAQQIAEVDAQAHEIFVTELLKRDSTLTNVSTVSPRK
jgi:HEAT repeat protein